MHKFIIISLIIFTTLYSDVSSKTNRFLEYSSKVFGVLNTESNKKKFFKEINFDKELQAWLEKTDSIFDTKNFVEYDAKILFTLDKSNHIESIKVLEDSTKNFNKFQALIAQLNRIQLPRYYKQLRDYMFELECSNLYIARPEEKTSFTTKTKPEYIDSKIQSLNQEFYLISPKFLDFPYIGQKVSFKNRDNLIFYAYIQDIKKSKLELLSYKVSNNGKAQLYKSKFLLNKKNKKHSIKKIIDSGIAASTKASLANSVNSYGIAPAALALIALTGASMIKAQEESSFSLEAGEILKMEERR